MGDESGGNVSLSDYAFNPFLKIKMLIDGKKVCFLKNQDIHSERLSSKEHLILL